MKKEESQQDYLSIFLVGFIPSRKIRLAVIR